MAFLAYSNDPFDMRHLDLHAAYDDDVTVQTGPGQTFQMMERVFYAGGTEFRIPAHEIATGGYLALDGATNPVMSLYGDNLAADGAGRLIDGTIHVLQGPVDGQPLGYTILGISLAATDFAAAAASQRDDRQVFLDMFSGNDLLYGSTADDVVLTGRGKDLWSDFGGTDIIWAGRGDDYITGGEVTPGTISDDTVHGGAGDDVLVNAVGRGHLYGDGGDDVLSSGTGSVPGRSQVRMEGGDGVDVFVFHQTRGHDVVADYTQGTDRLVLLQPGAVFDNLEITAQGNGALVRLGHWTVFLKGIDPGSLTTADFLAVAEDPLIAAETAFFTGWDYMV